MAKSRSPRASALMHLGRLLKPLPRSGALGLRPLVAGMGRLSASGRVERAMRAALGVEPGPAVGRYFARISDLAAFSLLIHGRGLENARLEGFCEIDPATEARMAEVLALGKGAILAVPHLTGSEVLAGIIHRKTKIALLARRSPDPQYQAFKEQWYRGLGVDVVWRPRKGTKFEGLQEMAGALRVLKRNGVLAITPDLLRAPGTGVEVVLFGRKAEIPAGPFFLSIRTGAPLVPAFFNYEAGRYRMWVEEPLPVRSEDRDEAIRLQAQEWTSRFEEFVREHPEMWQFWLDKRWSRWLEETPSCG